MLRAHVKTVQPSEQQPPPSPKPRMCFVVYKHVQVHDSGTGLGDSKAWPLPASLTGNVRLA